MYFAITALVAFLAGIIKVGLGMGAGILFTPILTLLMGPPVAIATMALLLLTANLDALVRYWRYVQWRTVAVIAPTALLFSVMGTVLIVRLPAGPVSKAIGVISVAVGLFRLWRARVGAEPIRLRPSLWNGLVIGAIGGLLNGMSTGGGLVLGLYLLALGLPKQQFVATAPVLVFLLDLTKLSVIWGLGAFPIMVFKPVLAALPLLFVGGYVGGYLNNRLSESRFHTALSVGVVVIGCLLVAR